MPRVVSKWPAAGICARSTPVMKRTSTEQRFLPRVLSETVYEESGLCVFF